MFLNSNLNSNWCNLLDMGHLQEQVKNMLVLVADFSVFTHKKAELLIHAWYCLISNFLKYKAHNKSPDYCNLKHLIGPLKQIILIRQVYCRFYSLSNHRWRYESIDLIQALFQNQLLKILGNNFWVLFLRPRKFEFEFRY